MTLTHSVCVDVSLAALWILPTQGTEEAIELVERWARDGTKMVGPPLFNAELASVVRLQVYLKRLLPVEGEEAFRHANQLAVETVTPARLYTEAWELAKKYDRPRTYDMQYLALAQLIDCDLWTADRRLVNALRGQEPRIHFVGEP